MMNIQYKYDKSALPEPVYGERPEWIELYYRAWETAFANIEYLKGLPQLACISGSGKIWQWDSCFMALFAKYANRTIPTMNNLDNLYRLQSEDGYLSMAYIVETGQPAFGKRINPPLFAWVEWEYYRFSGDDSRFEHVFPKLVRYYEWLKNNRTRTNGLYWFEDSGSSGMDNSPRSGFPALKLDGSDVCWVDLVSQQALSALYLAKIATYLRKNREEACFQAEHQRLCKLINHYHWSERHGFYYDVFNQWTPEIRHNFLNSKTIAAFWPMLCGAVDEERLNRLLEHLLNPDEFWGFHPVPTLSRDDANYDPLGGYWLGGVWAPANYMIACGLRNCGRPAIARLLSVKHLDAMLEVLKNPSYGGIWECYAPDLPRPATKNEKCDLARRNFVGWSGLGPIAMFIENILGFTFDTPSNTVTWRIASSSAHGIRNLDFGSSRVSLVCEDAVAFGARKIYVETSKPFTLTLIFEESDRTLTKTLKCGRSKLEIQAAPREFLERGDCASPSPEAKHRRRQANGLHLTDTAHPDCV